MTALREFQRLEAAGSWRNGPRAKRCDVIVSIGEATLTITDLQDRPLAHWSLAAIERKNPGAFPAVFHPDGDPAETLELGQDEVIMLEAIDKVRGAIDRARPHTGRLRRLTVLGVVAAAAAAVTLWLPEGLQQHAASVVPDANRTAIGHALLSRIEQQTGPICTTPETTALLHYLATRTNVKQIAVVRTGVKTSLALPGGIILLNRSFIEDQEDPAVAAGVVLAERLRAQQQDPLAALLAVGGLRTSFRLLTTGELRQDTLNQYVETALTHPRPPVDEAPLLAAFDDSAISSSPYGYALDATGETTLSLIEFDPMAQRSVGPVLNDQQWVTLQGICG